MRLCDGTTGNTYEVSSVRLPENLEKRLEALGVTAGTRITILNKKGKGILAVRFRGTRFAWGRTVTGNIEVTDT